MDGVIAFVVLAFVVASATTNVVLVWYLRKIITRSSLMTDVTSDTLSVLEDFLVHLEQVHELPLFYGDETIRDLLRHSKEVAEDIRAYRDGFIFDEEGVEVDRDEKEEAEEEELLLHSGT